MTNGNSNVHRGQEKPCFLPCLSTDGTRIFTSTADQRFLAVTPSDFLRTHFPMHLQSYHAGKTTTISEDELLSRLVHPAPTITGNRVMILYGAAGSGKSELVRWLQLQVCLLDTMRAEVMTRISRTDLDVFRIVQLLRQRYNIQPLQTATQQRWEECRQKPRTLAKILVLTALEQLFSSDEQVHALYYQLIDVIQTNLERCFAAMSQPSEDVGAFIELFSREDLEAIRANSAIPVPVEYETLRSYLLKAFRDQFLEGFDLPQTLRQIAQQVQQERKQRPILLIDDLVQSINLFATDLLDYLITLEEGCWDIIIGITPNSLEATQRGKELLDRITFLDTIDDRVEKFWLSDEYGLSSSFLNEANCADYARMYLSEFKRQNARPCDPTCPAFQCCRQLEPERSGDLLAPFNKEVFVRLFRSLPAGKGKVRYFTLFLRHILERTARGEDLLAVLKEYVRSELAVYHPDSQVAQIYEFYGPLLQGGAINECPASFNARAFFAAWKDMDDDEQPIIASLLRPDSSEHSSEQPLEVGQSIDAGKEAIKVWLAGGDLINKQLLRHVRRGIVKVIKDSYLLDTMTRLHIARPSRVLRWAQARMDTIPPIRLADVDDFEGIEVDQAIGPLAYLLHDFADAAGWREQELRTQLLNHPALPALFFRSMAYRRRIQSRLEQQLGMRIEELAFSLFVIATHLNRVSVELPPLLQEKIAHQQFFPLHYPERMEAERPCLAHQQVSMIRRLFDDCFKLRENVYDGLLLETVAEAIPAERAITLLQSINTHALSADFLLNEEPLSKLLAEVQNEIARLARLRENHRVKAVLVSICQAGLPGDELSQQLAALLGSLDGVEQKIDHFLSRCGLLELHKALCLAYHVDLVHYEQSLTLLRQALIELEVPANQSPLVSSLYKRFLKEEVEILVQFTHQDFRISISQLNAAFLKKIADQFPDLYQRLELCLRRG